MDLLARSDFDPLSEARRRARLRGDDRGERHAEALRGRLEYAEQEVSRLFREISTLSTQTELSQAEREQRDNGDHARC